MFLGSHFDYVFGEVDVIVVIKDFDYALLMITFIEVMNLIYINIERFPCRLSYYFCYAKSVRIKISVARKSVRNVFSYI